MNANDDEIQQEHGYYIANLEKPEVAVASQPHNFAVTINDEEGLRHSLLDRTASDVSLDRRSSVLSSGSNVSVTPRKNGSHSFKYKCCSICLADFTGGEKVKVLPVCGHTFHGDCLEQWLVRQFRCPNCNKEIVASDSAEQGSLAEPARAANAAFLGA